MKEMSIDSIGYILPEKSIDMTMIYLTDVV